MRRSFICTAVLVLTACSDGSDGSTDTANDPSSSGGGGGSAGEPGAGGSGEGGGAGSAGEAAAAGSGGSGGSTAAAGDTWTSFAQGFFADYCVECHGTGSATRDYTLLEQVTRDQDLIRCGVAVEKLDGCGDWPPPQQFPIGDGARPSDEERERLVAWLDAGAPE